jgi:hypothetical protein
MKIIKISEENLVFDNGITISSYHDQDCCESHWADFTVMQGYNLNTITGKQININDVEFDENIKEQIQLIKDMGFNLVAKDGSKYFIPCYASNNGYYSSDLELRIDGNGVKEKIDITDCQKWDED